MSGYREENVRLRIQTLSDLPNVHDQLEELIRLNKQVLETSHQNALSSRVDNAQIVTAIGGVTDALKAQKKASDDAGTSTKSNAKESNAELEKLAGQVRTFATLVGTAFTFEKVKEFGTEIIDTKTKIDSLKIALDVMLGSKAESAKLYAEFVQLAKTTPFTLEEVAEQGVKLKAYNIATADLIPTITALGNMAAAVGKEKLPQLTLAYGQVANTGKLMGTELKQFTEAGIPLFDLLAKAMDKPKEAVIELAQAHQISFADVRKAIMQASQEGGQYASLMVLQSKTLGGQVSNLADSYFVAKARIGDFFEGTIKKGIGTLNDLVEATVGSNTAIGRTLDVVKSVAAAFLTYQVATRAQAVASTALVAIETTKNVVYGAYLLTMRELTKQQIVFTAEQQAATVAARGLWATMAANPIGAIVTAVGLAVSAYYAFKAANAEVVSQLGEEEIRLRSERDNLNALAKAAILAADGSKQRKDAIDLLIKNYPQYFSGLNSEKTNNQQLTTILNSVNKAYERRIDLAREAYKSEGLAKAQKEFFEKEDEFFTNLQEKLGKSDKTLAPFEGSVKKLIDTLKSGGPAAQDLRDKLDDAFGNGAKLTQLRAQQILNGFIQIEKQSTESAARTAKINADSQAAEVEAVKKKYDVLEQQAAGNAKKLAALKKDEAAEIAKIENASAEVSYNNTVNNEEKKKQVTLLSAKQLAVIQKGIDADTLAEKIKSLDAQQAAEIEAINKVTVSRKASAAEIARLREEAEQKVLAIIAKYDAEKQKLYAEDRENFSRSLDVDISEFQRNQQARIVSFELVKKEHNQSYKEMAADAEKYEKEIQDANKETAKIRKETTEDAKQSFKEHIVAAGQLAGALAGMFAQDAQVAGLMSSVLQQSIGNLDVLSGKAKQVAADNLKNAQVFYDTAKVRYADMGKEGEAAIAKAGENVAKAEQNVQQVKATSVTTALGLAGTIIQIAEAINGQLNNMHAQLYTSISQGLGQALQAYSHYYDQIEQVQRESLNIQLQQTAGNLNEQLRLIDQFYDQQAETAKSKNYFETILSTSQQYADAIAQAGRDTVYNHAKYTQIMAEATIVIEKNRAMQEQQLLIDTAELAKQKAIEKRDATIAAIDAELETFKAAKNAEIQAEREKLEALKALNEQASSDQQLRLTADDVFRLDLLRAGEAREVQALEDAKQREIVRAQESGASAEEVARIRIAFDLLIKDKHAEYQNAIGDKTKEIALANEEVKAREKDKVNELEKTSKDEITKLQDQITAQEKQAAKDKEKANADAASAIIAANKQIFEANKQMAILELKAQIAILESKKSWTGIGNGKINDAQNQIRDAIGQIEGQYYSEADKAKAMNDAVGIAAGVMIARIQFGQRPQAIRVSDASGIDGAFDENGNPMVLTWNASGKRITVYDDYKQPFEVAYADGYVPATGKRYFAGTDYLDRMGHPAGIDTIPIFANEGERILPTSKNEAIGGRGLSNDDLVKKITSYDRLAVEFPQLLDPARWSDMARTTIALPAGIVNASGGKTIDVDGLRQDLKSVRKAIENQKTFSVNIDKTGFSTALLSSQGKTNYVENLLNR